MKKSQWQKDFEAFYEKYPDCPLSEDIEKLEPRHEARICRANQERNKGY